MPGRIRVDVGQGSEDRVKPLSGVRIVELASLGPVPWCGMLLADMGAEVIRVERPAAAGNVATGRSRFEVTDRGRLFLRADLKTPEGTTAVRRLVARADALMEGMRPGVAERLGLGPEDCWKDNPRLVYGRMTGWGQDGPLAARAGHDINYVALSGALHAIGPAGGPPVPPLNLVGDYGGGGAFLAMGLLAALLRARETGAGQEVDVAMVDGVASLMALQYGRFAEGRWRDMRGTNLLDGGTPWYGIYETADGRHVAVGAIEEPFYEALLAGLELDAASLPDRSERTRWPELRERLAAAFRTRSRDEWARRFESIDACVSPVLSLAEAPRHPHLAARATFVEVDGVIQPAPAPRFRSSREEGPSATGPRTLRAALAQWGLGEDDADALVGHQG